MQLANHAEALHTLARFNLDSPDGIIRDLRWQAKDASWWALVDPDGSGLVGWMWYDDRTRTWKRHAFGPDY